MSDLYTLQLQNLEEATSLSFNIKVVNRNLVLTLNWPTYIEEQYNIILQYFTDCAQSDPLVTPDEFVRNYDYCNYYLPLFDKTETELREWIQNTPILPQSIKTGSNDNEKYSRLLQNLQRCKAAWPLIIQYRDILCWNAQVLLEGDVTTGLVRPGGWYRTGDSELQFRFTARTDTVGRGDLGNVTVEFLVGQDI